MGPQTEPSISEGLTRWNPRRSRREGGQKVRGWDENGIPTKKKLKEFRLEEVVEKL